MSKLVDIYKRQGTDKLKTSFHLPPRDKEAGPQYKGQNLQPVTFENLVVHFDQGKFEEVLSGGGLMLHA